MDNKFVDEQWVVWEDDEKGTWTGRWNYARVQKISFYDGGQALVFVRHPNMSCFNYDQYFREGRALLLESEEKALEFCMSAL